MEILSHYQINHQRETSGNQSQHRIHKITRNYQQGNPTRGTTEEPSRERPTRPEEMDGYSPPKPAVEKSTHLRHAKLTNSHKPHRPSDCSNPTTDGDIFDRSIITDRNRPTTDTNQEGHDRNELCNDSKQKGNLRGSEDTNRQ